MVKDTEDEAVRVSVLNEIDQLIEISEQNRRAQAPNSGSSLRKGSGHNLGGSSQVQVDALNLRDPDDLVNEDMPLSQLRMSHILDAQDLYGSWHLSIVISDGSEQGGNPDRKTLHFLPF